MAVFEHILAKCNELGGRVMSVHSRYAAGEVLDCLERYPDAGTAVLHWFSGSTRNLGRANELGCWFSVGPAMLRSRKGRDLAVQMPRERILTESDGPFANVEGRITDRRVIPLERPPKIVRPADHRGFTRKYK